MTGELVNKRTSGDHPTYSIIEIGQYIEKSLGNLRGLVVAQIPVKDDQLTLMRKTLKELNVITFSLLSVENRIDKTTATFHLKR